MRALYDLTLMLAVLGGAIGGSQVPRFVQEYEQRLGGAFQEASRQAAAFRRIAEENRLDFEDYVAGLSGDADASIAATGKEIAAVARRAATLEEQVQGLREASRLLKPVLLLRRHDPELLRATWDQFRPTLTLEPAFAALGALLGWLINAAFWLRPRRRQLVR